MKNLSVVGNSYPFVLQHYRYNKGYNNRNHIVLLVLVFAIFKMGVAPLNDQDRLITCSLAFAVCMSAYWAIKTKENKKKTEKEHHVFTGSTAFPPEVSERDTGCVVQT